MPPFRFKSECKLKWLQFLRMRSWLINDSLFYQFSDTNIQLIQNWVSLIINIYPSKLVISQLGLHGKSHNKCLRIPLINSSWIPLEAYIETALALMEKKRVLLLNVGVGGSPPPQKNNGSKVAPGFDVALQNICTRLCGKK